jgi:hypothetical protein
LGEFRKREYSISNEINANLQDLTACKSFVRTTAGEIRKGLSTTDDFLYFIALFASRRILPDWRILDGKSGGRQLRGKGFGGIQGLQDTLTLG